MSETLGKVERPAADRFHSRRKLYLVFLVFTHESAPQEYKDRCEQYWSQIADQLAKLESKAGAAIHIYHESVYEKGEAGLALIEKAPPYSHELAKTRSAAGATVEALEDRELAAELHDWERFMLMGFASSKVGELVRDLYTQARKKHNEHVVKTIDATLGSGEAGVLFMREGHGLQFPSDIEVFSVVPPALDELHRWLRDQQKRSQAFEEQVDQDEEKVAQDGEQVEPVEPVQEETSGPGEHGPDTEVA